MPAERTIGAVLDAYDPAASLEKARTIPASWYTDPRVADLERRAVFQATWQVVARADQVVEPGQYVTADIAGEPIVVVRGRDGVLRGFHNVCRHHAAAVCDQPHGKVAALHCPYHGWTYGLDGTLKGMPEFDGVADFDKSQNGLVAVATACWENFVFARVDPDGPSLPEFLGELATRAASLRIGGLKFFDRRTYDLDCNWKVFVDNYLDGGYHVPHAHKSLNSVLDYANYRIETVGNICVQSSPLAAGGDELTAAVRRGKMAYYFWVYPNFMLNWYEGVMDTNLVLPLGIDRCRVFFDFYFADVSPSAGASNKQSVDVAERVQMEDVGVCESVQRGLGSRAYDTGRLSVRREAGEQQFHRLLHAGLTRAAAACG